VKRRVLVVEDDSHTADWLRIYLERAGYRVFSAPDGTGGLKSLETNQADLILLDLMLPDGDGREFCRQIRLTSDVPVIMLTALSARNDRLEGLAGGADDYVTKPFDPDELLLRMEAVLRRYKGQVRRILRCGPLYLDRDRGEFTLFGEPVRLSGVQRDIMALFMENCNCILSRSQLMEQALPPGEEVFDRAVDTHIQRLRKLIHREGFEPLQTVYGEGYRLVWEDE